MCTQQARGSRPNDGIGRSLQRARRRVERRLGRFGIGKGKKKVTGQDDTCGSCKLKSVLDLCYNNNIQMLLNDSDFSRRSSYDTGEGPRDTEVVVLKERFLIPTEPLRDGMLRFSFLLETCAPGSVPDPQLIAAVLDLVSDKILLAVLIVLKYVYACKTSVQI